jgi:TonB family protein
MTEEVVVRVKVNVDATGKVIAAEPVVGGSPVPEALADSTISAVKRWEFEPARRGGDKVPGDIVLSFTFRK